MNFSNGVPRRWKNAARPSLLMSQDAICPRVMLKGWFHISLLFQTTLKRRSFNQAVQVVVGFGAEVSVQLIHSAKIKCVVNTDISNCEAVTSQVVMILQGILDAPQAGQKPLRVIFGNLWLAALRFFKDGVA